MKICFVTEHFPPHIGGVEQVFLEYAKHLSTRGHEIRVVTSHSGGIEGEKDFLWGKVWYLPSPSFFGHPLLPRKALVPHIQWADLVHTTTFTAAWSAQTIARKYCKPCLITVHEVLAKRWFSIEKNPVRAFGFWLFEQLVIRKKYNRWHVISRATEKDLARLGIPKSNISLIYHGIDQLLWNPSVAPEDLNSFFDTHHQYRFFLYSGRPGKTKGTSLLLRAIEKIEERLPEDIRFGFIVSRNPKSEREQFDREVKSSLAAHRLFLHETVSLERLPALRKGALSVIVPSLTEGFGFSAAESSALGVPVIASTAGSLPEVVGGQCLFFQNGDVDDLVQKILLASHQKFELHPPVKFDWDASANKMEQLYQTLI